MGDRYRPVDLARAVGVSSQQVRNDEAAGVLPAVARTASGHRRYGPLHLSALLAYRALARAYGAPQARAVMIAVHAGELSVALEHLDTGHVQLHQERLALRATRRAVDAVLADPLLDARPEDDLSIGELAAALGVRTSTLRAWDAADLISPQRTAHHGYRRYSPLDVRDARIVHLLRLEYYPYRQIRSVLETFRAGTDSRAVSTAIEVRAARIAARARAMLTAGRLLDEFLTAASHEPQPAAATPATGVTLRGS